MRMKLTRVILSAVVAVAISGPSAPADVVQDWNGEALKVTFPVGPPQARMLAIVHVAIHDAINSITGQYQTYAVRHAAPAGASPVAAAAAAAHHVLVTLFPQMTATYDAALVTSLDGIPEPNRSDGVLVGQEVGEAILALRTNDGFSAPASYTPGSGPGVWVPTPPAFAPALLPGLGRVRPFALRNGSQFRPDGPPRLTSERWASDLNEVQTIGSADAALRGHRTPEQTATARFWLGNMIPIMQRIAQQVSIARPLGLSANARFFALLNIAGIDSYIATWDAKYAYNFWRPVTAIQNADLDDNPETIADPTWMPFGTTPPFPEYVSGHTAYTRASVEVLEEVFGRGHIAFVATNPAVPPAEGTRPYSKFRELSKEMIEARILAGIHFRTADRDGDRLGRDVAQFAIARVLRSRPHESHEPQ
jgi:hypothetical protein